jgi:hypothetical protein
VTESQLENQAPHQILWGNLRRLLEVLQDFSEQAMARGEEQASQARMFVAKKVAGVQRGSDLDELWDSVELVFRQITAVAVEAQNHGQDQAAQAFVGSSAMLLGLLRPDLSEEDRHQQLMASLEKRAEERAMQ